MPKRSSQGLIQLVVLVAVMVGCSGGGGETTPTPAPETPAPETPTPPTAPAPTATGEVPASLPRGLAIAYSQFRVEDGRVTATPGPARVDLVYRAGGEWRTETIEDQSANVFHKALAFTPPGGTPGILTLSGQSAAVKLWHRTGPGQWTSETLWTEDFGGRFSRMRDAEVANLYGDGDAIAVATHDQGVVATLRPSASGVTVTRLDSRPNTFVHEIEIGDLDHDGTLEVYATPSEPNDLDGGAQHGEVVRYVPSRGGERTVVADLGNRHAKEIYVGDVDGDGTDELYVSVEALTTGSGADVQIVEPVEIRRYDASTPPDARVVVATIRDRFSRFMTVGDVDHDGHREMVVATFSTGLWLLRPGRDAHGEWAIENIDRESGGFEHAALFTDLDGDGSDELYVAADTQGELRRYAWVDGRPRRSVIGHRDLPSSMMAWNIMPFPVSILGQ